MSNKPVIGKKWVKEQFDKGTLVADVLAEINSTLPEGNKLSAGGFNKQLKEWGIDLKKKPRPLPVKFVDDTETEIVVNTGDEFDELDEPVEAEPAEPATEIEDAEVIETI